MREFEYDEAKSLNNQRKHGIDFPLAQKLWDDPDALEIQTKLTDEPKFLIIGLIQGKHWSAVVTYRKHKIRLTSVRRSRKKEVLLYAS